MGDERKPQFIPPLGRFEAHPIRLLIQDMLRNLAIGETLTYEQMSEATGWDVLASPHLLGYARDVLIDEGLVFDTVIGVGVKRVDDSGALAVAEGQGRRMVSAAHRGGRMIAKAVNYEALSPGERVRFGVLQVRIGLTQQFGRKAIGNRIQKLIEGGKDMKALVADSLAQFR